MTSTKPDLRRPDVQRGCAFGKLNSVERFRQPCSMGAFLRLAMLSEAMTVDTSDPTVEEAVRIVDAEVERATVQPELPLNRDAPRRRRVPSFVGPVNVVR